MVYNRNAEAMMNSYIPAMRYRNAPIKCPYIPSVNILQTRTNWRRQIAECHPCGNKLPWNEMKWNLSRTRRYFRHRLA